MLTNVVHVNRAFEKEAGSVLHVLRQKLGGKGGKREVASLSPWLSSYPNNPGMTWHPRAPGMQE